MSSDINVIWRRGDGEMPTHAEQVVDSAQDDLLLMSLQLPFEIVDMIRNNARNNAQTVNDYISAIVVGHFNNNQ